MPSRTRSKAARDLQLRATRTDPDSRLRYRPNGPVLAEHLRRTDYAQVLIGPLGSAKTTNNIIKLVKQWERAPIDERDVHVSRSAAVRNTYADLAGTTVKDFLEVVEPLGIGEFKAKDMGVGNPVFRAKYEAADGRLVEAELNFIAFDIPEHARKARGLRLSCVWFNELKELSPANVKMVMSRLRRFRPDLYNAQSHCWYGMLGDSNAPDKDHWLAKMVSEWREGRMPSWWFGIQPGAVTWHGGSNFKINPQAENLAVVGEDYYLKQLEGADPAWVRQNLGNEFVFYADGRPVHPEFSETVHVASHTLEPTPGLPLGLGFDFGRTPACAIFQRQPDGRILVLRELVTPLGKGTFAKPFGRLVNRYLSQHFPGFEYEATADPAGDEAGQGHNDTLIEQLAGDERKPGIDALPAFTNQSAARREALAGQFRELIDGRPAIMFDPSCRTLIRGLAGAWQYRRVQVAGFERYHDKPEKSIESHVCEALEYGLMGLGEGVDLIHSQHEPDSAYHRIPDVHGNLPGDTMDGWAPPQHYFE